MTITEDVIFIPDKAALVHYIIYRIAAANLPAQALETLQHSQVIAYTEESARRMTQFTALAVQAWNETHAEQLDATEIYDAMKDMRNRDVLDARRQAMVEP